MKKPLIALLHIGYWFVYLLLAMLLAYAMSGNKDMPENVGEDVMAMAFLFVLLIPAVITFYTCYLLLFPRYFGRKKFGQAFLLALGVAASTTFAGVVFLSFVLYPECAEEAGPEGSLYFGGIVTYFQLVGGLVAFVIRGFSTWFEEVELKEALQQKNHAMELALVKSQLDPHFLFNTINNIDVLILKDAEEASDYLNRLSDIMRFMLYETKTETIALSKELDYIEKYIALQRIRTANETYVDFQVMGASAGRSIAPMVFIPFIENAFKHTTNKKAEHAIRITLDITPAGIRMNCINRLEAHRQPTQPDGGLGNELIRKRLELLYPGQHQLEVNRTASEYHVHLFLNT